MNPEKCKYLHIGGKKDILANYAVGEWLILHSIWGEGCRCCGGWFTWIPLTYFWKKVSEKQATSMQSNIYWKATSISEKQHLWLQ